MLSPFCELRPACSETPASTWFFSSKTHLDEMPADERDRARVVIA